MEKRLRPGQQKPSYNANLAQKIKKRDEKEKEKAGRD
jgi:hypothetical protein